MTEPTIEFDPQQLKGYRDERAGVELLEAPVWHAESGKWRALANWRGMLAVVELNITVKGNPYESKRSAPAD